MAFFQCSSTEVKLPPCTLNSSAIGPNSSKRSNNSSNLPSRSPFLDSQSDLMPVMSKSIMVGAIKIGVLNPDFKESVENILSRCKDSDGDGVLNPEKSMGSVFFSNDLVADRISSKVTSRKSVSLRKLYFLLILFEITYEILFASLRTTLLPQLYLKYLRDWELVELHEFETQIGDGLRKEPCFQAYELIQYVAL